MSVSSVGAPAPYWKQTPPQEPKPDAKPPDTEPYWKDTPKAKPQGDAPHYGAQKHPPHKVDVKT